MSKNGIKIYKSSKSIKSFNKNISPKNVSNQLMNLSNKYASSSSNNIVETIGDLSKCITNTSNFKTPVKHKKEKLGYSKKRRKSRDIWKLLKNKERIKIPTGKRMSNANNRSKLNLNSINNILESYKPSTKEIKIRRDKNGIEINKVNKKKVHITFLDKISPNNKITETIIIKAYKKYNFYDDNSKNENNNNNCGVCCSIV